MNEYKDSLKDFLSSLGAQWSQRAQQYGLQPKTLNKRITESLDTNVMTVTQTREGNGTCHIRSASGSSGEMWTSVTWRGASCIVFRPTDSAHRW